jgi:hypothetical protein
MADQPLSDPMLEAFAVKVSTGVIPSHAYHQVYFPDQKLSKQSAWEGGKKRMALAVIKERIRQLSAQITRFPDRQPDQPTQSQAPSQAVKAKSQAKGVKPPNLIDDGQPDNPRQALLRRLWRAVNSDTNPEAIAAVKALRDWIESDKRAAQASSIADPAIIAGHVLAVSGDYAALDAPGKADYCRRIVAGLDSLGLPRADFQAALADSANRDFAPPLSETIDSIDPNAPTPPIVDNQLLPPVILS